MQQVFLVPPKSLLPISFPRLFDPACATLLFLPSPHPRASSWVPRQPGLEAGAVGADQVGLGPLQGLTNPLSTHLTPLPLVEAAPACCQLAWDTIAQS